MKVFIPFGLNMKVCSIIVLVIAALSARSQTCEITMRNDTLTSPNHLLVDIYLKATSGPFYYADAQFKITANPGINSQPVTATIVPGYSDLTYDKQQPTRINKPYGTVNTFVVIGCWIPSTQDSCSIISASGQGTRICRIDFTTADAFLPFQANLQLTSSSPLGTAVFYMNPIPNAVLCSSSIINTNLINPVLNQPVNSSFTLTGGYYCSGGGDIVLSGSETGISYKLTRNGDGQFPIIAGTGNQLVWSNQPAGNYSVYAWRTAEYVNATIGNVSMVHFTESVGGMVGPATEVIGIGSNTGTMTLTGENGAVMRWEKQYNGGGYSPISNTTDSCSEIPGPAGIYNYRCKVYNQPCPTVYSAENTVIVTRTPVTTAGNVSNACPGSTISVPVTVKLFSSITSMSLRLDYDPTFMTYSGFSNANPSLTGMIINDVSTSTPPLRKIMIVWTDVVPKTIADDSKIADLNFTCISNVPTLSFNTTANGGQDCEYADENGIVLPDSPQSVFFHDATVNIGPAPAGPITGTSNVCRKTNHVAYSVLPITNATGYNWQVPSGASIVSGSNTNSILVNFSESAVSGDITVTGTNGCPASGESSSFPVTINQLPVPVISGPDTICTMLPSGTVYSTDAGMTGYTWTITGGSIIAGAGTNSITTSWISPGTGNVSVNYNTQQGCTSPEPAIKNITLKAVPPNTGIMTGPSNVLPGQTGVVFSVEPLPTATGYVWTLPAGATITSGANTNAITVDFANTAGGGAVRVYGTNSCGTGCAGTGIFLHVIYGIGGKYTYFNNSNIPIDTLFLKLYNNGTLIATDQTDWNGDYSFTGIGPGTYSLLAYPAQTWSGVNGTDALIVQRYFAGMETLAEPVSLLAADVNNSGSINGTDALKIKRRFAGYDNYFEMGDWTFSQVGTGGTQVTLGSSPIIVDFYGLCVGDVNGSYTFGGNKPAGSEVILVSHGEITAYPGQSVDLPVRVENDITVNAISLVIPYPEEQAEISGIEMVQGEPVFNTVNGELRIAWSDLQSLDLKAGDILLTLKVKVKEVIPGNPVIELHPGWESELADDMAKVIPSAELSCPAIKILNAIGINDRNSGNENISVYPNPANDILNVEFSLESRAEFSFQLSDVTGRIVKMIPERSFLKGEGKIQISSSDLANGLYNLKVKIDYKDGPVEYLRKVIIDR